ncbi:MAG: hypothetical protein NVS1B4_16960 [Gemmatimonadaceae bacterium]
MTSRFSTRRPLDLGPASSRILPLVGLAAGAVAAATAAGAQLPGSPVLQNAFASPGFTVAANASSTDNARSYALAAAWSPSSARFVVSGAAGTLEPQLADRRPAYGARIAVPVVSFFDDASIGVAAFAGFGGASRSGYSTTHVPAGISLGYRRAIGATRGVSVYAAPFYLYARDRVNEAVPTTASFLRGSAGVDVAVTGSLGITVGVEGGRNAKLGEPGPAGTVAGVALSYALSR